MIDCPLCESKNIEGEDFCQQCGQPLSDTHLANPPTAVERSLVRDRIESLAPAQPITVSPDAPVAEVLKLLVERKIGCVLVLDPEGELVGVFTERDAIAKLAGKLDELGSHPVSEFMTPAPQTLEIDAKVAFAVRQMDQGGYRHVPLVDENARPVGIISVRDILQYFTDKMRQ